MAHTHTVVGAHRRVIERSRLHRRLDAGLHGAMTSICAPAGYGKTALLSSWSASLTQPVAHVALRAEHNEPRRFWAAVAGATPGFSAPAQLRPETIATALPTPLILILDDAQEVDDIRVWQTLSEVLLHSPQLRVVAAGRGRRPLSSVRSQAEGRRTEIGGRDLAFSTSDVAALLASERDDVDPAYAAALARAGAGWPIAVRLLADHVDGGAPAAVLPATVREDLDRYIQDEILRPLPAALATTLLRASIVEELNPDLTTALCGDPEAWKQLSTVDSAVIPVDISSDGLTLRIHRLLRGSLRRERARTFPAETAAGHSIAAEYFARNSAPLLAIRHARAAHDSARLAELLATHWTELIFDHSTELRRIVRELPEEIRQSSPDLLTLHSIGYSIVDGDSEAGADIAELALELHGAPERAADMRTSALLATRAIAAAYQDGRQADARAVGESCLRRLRSATARQRDEARDVTALLHVTVGTGRMLAGDLPGAIDSLHTAIALARQSDVRLVRFIANAGLALIYMLLGRASTARQYLTRTTVLDESGRWMRSAVGTPARVATLLLQAEDGDPAEPPAGVTPRLFRPLTAYGEAMQSLADDTAGVGLAHLRSAYDELAGWTAPPLGSGMMAVAKAELLIAAGQGEQALAIAGSLDPRTHAVLCPQVTMARAYVRESQLPKALSTLEPFLRHPDRYSQRGALDAQVTAALAKLGLRRTESAIGSFRRALEVSAATGIIRPFLLAPRPALRALIAHARSTTDSPIIARVCDGLTARVGGIAGTADPAVTSPRALTMLSPRERFIVSYLSNDLSLPEIAAQLAISQNTLKTHLRRIYRKLGVSSRAAAVNYLAGRQP